MSLIALAADVHFIFVIVGHSEVRVFVRYAGPRNATRFSNTSVTIGRPIYLLRKASASAACGKTHFLDIEVAKRLHLAFAFRN